MVLLSRTCSSWADIFTNHVDRSATRACVVFMGTAVLFVIFNRPDLACAVFEKIVEAKPERLYIAADGPRKNRTGESEKCELTRQSILGRIDWDCELKCKFEEKNLGCKIAVSSAIDWFFSFEEEGIILEDDCLPNPTFFRFCEEMLSLYRTNDKIKMIAGTNFKGTQVSSKVKVNTYCFLSRFTIWGWATWKRAWNAYDVKMKTWKQNLEDGSFESLFTDWRIYHYWSDIFNETYSGKINAWGYQWVYCCLISKGLSVVPNVNLITNIGFREDATHTSKKDSAYADLPSFKLAFPLLHPSKIEGDDNLNKCIYRKVNKTFKKYGYYPKFRSCMKKLRYFFKDFVKRK